MTWETRIFFEIGNDKHEQYLSLRQAAVAQVIAPGLVFGRDDRAGESRTDLYLVLPKDFAGANQVGLKGRDVRPRCLVMLEAKTADQQNDDNTLAHWTKYGHHVKPQTSLGSVSLLTNFLTVYAERSPLLQTLQETIATRGEKLALLPFHKVRRQAPYHSLWIEETDLEVVLPNRSTPLRLRSWAAEGESVEKLEEWSTSWLKRLQAAADAIDEQPPARTWVCSYPALVQELYWSYEEMTTGTTGSQPQKQEQTRPQEQH